MALEILSFLLAVIIGCIAGTITGLSPGIHINLVSVILISQLDKLSNVPIISLAIFIVSMSITHTFIDFIPSIFLGAPEEDNFLSILPGHQMLLEGKGYQAFILTLYGSLFGIILILLVTPLFLIFLPSLYAILKTFMPYLLIFISLYIILRADKILISFLIFALAGLLGLLTFNNPVQEPLLPLLSGLFGISSLIISLKFKTNPKKQKVIPLKKIRIPKLELLKSILAVSLFSPLCSFLPGIGSSHAATFGSEIVNLDKKGFLFMVGATNTIVMGLSYVTVYSILKSRTGTAAAVQELMKTFSQNDLLIIILAIVISGSLAFIIGIKLAKLISRTMNKISYGNLTLGIIILVLLVNLIFTNWLGLIVLLTSTSLGIFAVLSNSRRINLIACLILPAIIYYIF
ncbi:MAG: tripartite tricarboxylate transporter permease [archaeon]